MSQEPVKGVTIIPIPARLMAAARDWHSSPTPGFWLKCQDQLLIDEAGAAAIHADTEAEAWSRLEERLGTPPQCTRLGDEHTWYLNCNRTPQALDEFMSRCNPPSSKTSFRSVVVGGRDRCAVVTLLPQPKIKDTLCIGTGPTAALAETKLTQLDLERMVVRAGSKGLIVPYSMCPQAWKDAKAGLNILSDMFLIQSTGHGIVVIYDPKRVNRLKKLRAKRATASDKDRPWIKHTCYNCVLQLVVAYRDVCNIAPITWLYGYGSYSSAGIDTCMRTILKFHALAAALGKTAQARKATRIWLRRLSYHRTTIIERDHADGTFRPWFARELALAGGAPADATTRYKKLKDGALERKARGVAGRLYEDEQHKRIREGRTNT
jgi:hypothetical protein